MRICRLLRLAILVASTQACAPAVAAVIVLDLAESEAHYNQYDPNFQPQWQGETIVSPQPVNPSTGGDDDFPQPQAPAPSGSYLPIELVESLQRVTTSTTVRLAEDATASGDAHFGLTRTQTDQTLDESFAHYAVINDQAGVTMGRGLAVAEQTSTVDHSQIDAWGRIWANAQLLSTLQSVDTHADALANSSLLAVYQVHEDVSFSLSGSVAGVGELDMRFDLIDQSADTVAFTSSFGDYLERSFEMEGVLTPGTYALQLTGFTDHHVATHDSSDGTGFGEFSLHFSAGVRGSGVSDHAWFAEQRASAVESLVAVPEPSCLKMALALSISCMLAGRQASKRRGGSRLRAAASDSAIHAALARSQPATYPAA